MRVFLGEELHLFLKQIKLFLALNTSPPQQVLIETLYELFHFEKELSLIYSSFQWSTVPELCLKSAKDFLLLFKCEIVAILYQTGLYIMKE